MAKSSYRVTLSKNWQGPARVRLFGVPFDRRIDDRDDEGSRIKVMSLTPSQVETAKEFGFLVVKQAASRAARGMAERITRTRE